MAKATLIKQKALPNGVEVVPTIFITNRTLIHLPEEKTGDLAQRITQKLKGQFGEFANQTIREIQLDCDWSLSTKNKYFKLLSLLKKGFSKEGIFLSATIRLHQIKYPEKTGIPPVKRGMLMYYNMGEVRNNNTENSILDNKIGQQYLGRLGTYPLPLDVALPLFQWGVLFRNGKMIKLLNQLTAEELADNQRFGKKAKNHWEVLKSTYLKGVYLYQNDEIRIERVAFSDLQEAALLLSRQLKKAHRNIVFYHLDREIIKEFPIENLKVLVETFGPT